MKEGQEATVHGVIFEIDTQMPAGVGLNQVPSAITSDCLTRWSETFVYEDFLNGGTISIPLPNGEGTGDNCEWTVDIDVRAD